MKNKGFTLIELLVVITVLGIIAGGGVLLVTNIMQKAKFDATTKRMENLKFAIIGNPALITNNVRTDFGYNGDMGRLPGATVPVLDELVNQGVQTVWNSSTQVGWHGPYIRSPFQEDPLQYQKDGWGNSFSYNNTTGVITSLGSDGVSGGTGWASDINSEALNTIITNSVTVKVFDARGNPGTGSTITVYYPVNGVETPTSYVLLLVDAGMHTFANIPTGLRRIVVTFSGETYTKWVAVVPTTAVAVDYRTVQATATPNGPTGPGAVPLSTTQIRLSWTGPTLNTDGTTLTDLVSYNIYRSITTGTETFLINTGNTNISYTDTGLTEAQTYYYQVSAVNAGGNGSARSAEANAMASPVQQNLAVVPALGIAGQLRTIRIRNFGTGVIRVSTMELTWVASANPRNLDRIRMRQVGFAWTTVWSGSRTTPTGVLNLSTTFNLSTGVDYQIELRYGTTAPYPTLTSLTIRLNTSDGLLIVY